MRIPSSRSDRSASGVDALIGSATAMRPAGRSSTARNTTVCPSRRSASARAVEVPGVDAERLQELAFPSATRRPSTRPVTPCPGSTRKSAASSSASPRSRAAATMAPASGCSLPRSRLAARRRSSASSWGGRATSAASRGLPSVSVPVLSTTSVSTFSRTSSASACLTRTPAVAPRPVPTMIDIGVASPSAHGHAMISTATALTSAWASRGSGPSVPQATALSSAAATTAGTK